jgi:fructokinase
MKEARACFIGVDIGGTKVELALLSYEKKRPQPSSLIFLDEKNPEFHYVVKKKIRFPTLREEGYERFLSCLVQHILQLLKDGDFTLQEMMALGLGLPGAVDTDRSMMLNGNTTFLIERPIIQDLSILLNIDSNHLFVENDANCFILAEAMWGLGPMWAKEHQVAIQDQNAIGLILGTGMGGGLFLQGKLYQARHGAAGELGHTSLNPYGERCYCGRRGCAELYLSGTSISHRYQMKTGQLISSESLFSLDYQTDHIFQDICQETTYFLSLILANLINTFAPDYIVFGGGLSQQRSLFQGLEEKVREQIFVKKNMPKLSKNILGDSSGVFGAAMLGIVNRT